MGAQSIRERPFRRIVTRAATAAHSGARAMAPSSPVVTTVTRSSANAHETRRSWGRVRPRRMPRRDRCGNFTETGATERSDKERWSWARGWGRETETSRPQGSGRG
ncbi:hypothetical protein HOK021_65930 [Streptomyces hygroscopicus]|nr:hypothetical protein HOK021_65930 [Streptomyces hygroscopicus]